MTRKTSAANAIALPDRLTLSPDLSFTEWRKIGVDLAKAEKKINWLIGDWWRYGQRYGDRLKVVKRADWKGPSLQTCMNNASVCRAFETSRRREFLSFTHHQEVAALKPAVADRLLDKAEREHLSVKELRSEVFRHQRETTKTTDGGTVEDLFGLVASGKRFAVVLVDPPWRFDFCKDERRSAERRYDSMALDDIKALPVSDLAADDCALFLWAPCPKLAEAMEVITAWGFVYKTIAFNWIKTNRSGEGLFTGMGFWTRSNSESCLFATRGSPRRIAKDVHQIIMAPVGDKHSAKPKEAHERIERLLGGPYLELFARQRRHNWTVWGDEIERGEILEAAE